ncbi:MAG TPA: methylmalonyl-CoA mutase family protein [Aestuariivirga sp.]|nr:methylmalonyl-CoA mutase family protein [Aestuariivirga sp.]
MNDFPQATLEMWQARVAAILKGESAEKLAGRTADGLRIEPLYQQIQAPRAERADHAPWTVMQRVDHPDGVKANAQALDDLENGAGGLCIVNGDADVGRVLQGVALHAIHTRLEGDDGLTKAFAAYVGKKPIDPARLDVSFGMGDVEELVAQGFKGPFLEADGRVFHEQGASEAQELACVLARIVGALRKFDQLSPESIVGATLAANQDMFLTLAKFRAIRLLWARVLEASGIAHQPLRLHGETSRRMMARLDPHTNILRATAAVFGAGLGGADTFTVLPFSIAQGLPNAFARRMARNTQLIVLEESHLWRVADPASGSGYVETLTHDLCERAWTIFQGIEKTGKLPAFDSQNKTSDPIIGTNSHSLPKEFEAAVESIP